jgi:uncharacterized membrane protein
MPLPIFSILAKPSSTKIGKGPHVLLFLTLPVLFFTVSNTYSMIMNTLFNPESLLIKPSNWNIITSVTA